MKLSNRTIKLAVVVLFTAITLLFFYKLLVPGRLVYQGDLTSSDVTELNFPRRDLLASSLKKGSLPVWTDLIGDGFPLLAEGQTGIFYPPNLVFFGLLDSVTAYNLVVILSFILAAVVTYMFARSLGRGRYASAFAGVAFGFSGFFIARLRFMALLNGCSWLPLALYGVEKFHKTRRWRFAALTGVTLAIQLFAGFVQIFYITALAVIVFFLYRFAPDVYRAVRAKKWRRETGIAIGMIVVVFLVAALVAMVQLVPSVQGIKSSNRSGGVTFEEATVFPMRPPHLAMFVSPFQFGNPALGTYDAAKNGLFWENNAFCGVSTLLLALIALVVLVRRKGRKSSETFFWLATPLLSILIALGSSTFFYRFLWSFLPGMKIFRFPQRFLLFVVLALAMLGAIGLDYLMSLKPLRKWIGPVAIAVVVAELFVFSITQVNTINSKELLRPPSTVAFLKQHPGRYRIGHIGELESWKLSVYDVAHGWHKDLEPYIIYRAMMEPELNMLYDVEAVASQGQYGIYRVKNLLAFQQAADYRADFRAAVPDSSVRILGAQNVRYVFSEFLITSPLLKMSAHVDLGKKQRGIYIYENLAEQPRVSVAGDYVAVKDIEKVDPDELFGPSYNPSKVLLDEPPPAGFVKGGGGKAVITSYSPREVRITADVERSGILVLADSFYPGWKAMVDGKPAQIIRANYAFRGLVLPGGRHKVVFSYTPENYLLAGLVSILTVLALLALLVIAMVRERRKKAVNNPLAT